MHYRHTLVAKHGGIIKAIAAGSMVAMKFFIRDSQPGTHKSKKPRYYKFKELRGLAVPQ